MLLVGAKVPDDCAVAIVVAPSIPTMSTHRKRGRRDIMGTLATGVIALRPHHRFPEATMLMKPWALAAAVAVLLGTGLLSVDAAGQAPDTRAERLRRQTDNVALQNIAPFKVF